MKRNIIQENWEIIRNRPASDQEKFIQLVSEEIFRCHHTLKFIGDDKYSGCVTFKHVDGNVRSEVDKILRGNFWSDLKELLG